MDFNASKHLVDLYRTTAATFGKAEEADDPYLCAKVLERFRMMTAMHTIVCNLNDESAYMVWIHLVPDAAEDEDLMYIAYENDLFEEAVNLFRRLFSKYGMDLNSLYVANETY